MFAKKLHLSGLVRDAPKLSLPGKLVFPRLVDVYNFISHFSFISSNSMHSSGNFSMLGLGDIVMPGLLLCFVLRYDAHRKTLLSGVEVGLPPPATYYSRITYFHCSLIGYFLGLHSMPHFGFLWLTDLLFSRFADRNCFI